MKKDIISYNDYGEEHGYCEIYWSNGILNFRCTYSNGELVGLCESYYENGNLIIKRYYIR